MKNLWKDTYYKQTQVSTLLTTKEKTNKDLTKIKDKFQWYKQHGLTHTRRKKEKIQSLRDLANGVINKEDYLGTEELNQLKTIDPSIKFNEDEVDLEYFAIAPNIINYLEGELDKMFIDYSAKAINKDATNEIIETRNKELRTKLEELLAKQLGGVTQDPEQIKQEVQSRFQYYSADFRHEIEEWANHLIELDNQKFNMKTLSRKGFRELLIHEEPYYHINLIDNYYYPEIIQPENAFFIKSKSVDDASNYTMFGWFDEETLHGLLGKYQLTEDQTKEISDWHTNLSAYNIAFDGQSMLDHSSKVQNSLNNYKLFTGLEKDIDNDKLITVTSIYWLEPRKIGILSVMVDGSIKTTKVDDSFKTTKPAKYKFNRKIREELVEGEHLEWIYINELWKGVEISPIWNSVNSNVSNVGKTSVFLTLGAHPIQYSHKSMDYGIKIPVHGGAEKGWSLTSKMYPWQRFYNYLGNRCKQILYTELGKFLLINQNIIPDTNIDEQWGENKLVKFFTQAKELSLGVTDQSMLSTGMIANQGFGQMVDLSKTDEVAQKMQVMAMIKQECYASVGLNIAMLGNQSPYQTATSVSQNQQLSITQLTTLYSRHLDIMRSVVETMVETAQYLTSKGDFKDLTYTTSDGQRIIFNMGLENTLIYKLGIFINHDVNDVMNLEKIRAWATQDNTTGADTLEKVTLLSADSKSEIFTKLKKLKEQRQKKEDSERKFQEEQQQKVIDAQEKMKDTELEWKSREAELDRLNQLEEASIKALGFGNSTSDEISKEIIELQKLKLREADLNRNIAMDKFNKEAKMLEIDNRKTTSKDSIVSKEAVKMAELELRKKELEASERRTSALLKK